MFSGHSLRAAMFRKKVREFSAFAEDGSRFTIREYQAWVGRRDEPVLRGCFLITDRGYRVEERQADTYVVFHGHRAEGIVVTMSSHGSSLRPSGSPAPASGSP